jgi:hypothetical protein
MLTVKASVVPAAVGSPFFPMHKEDRQGGAAWWWYDMEVVVSTVQALAGVGGGMVDCRMGLVGVLL